MNTAFTDKDIEKISAVLGVTPKWYGNHHRFEIKGADPSRQLALEVYPLLQMGESEGTLISVFTPNSNLQLQHCTGYVVSEMLGEVTFIADAGMKVSGLIIEREGGCSLYANVDRALLSGDFTKLGPEVMMSGLALSLSEVILSEEDEQSFGLEE